MATTFGTHNLHDETGSPTGFADIIVFTEAIPSTVKEKLPNYHVYVARRQKDLVIAVRKSLDWQKTGISRYKKIHGGMAGVTPHRGVFWVNGRLNGKRVTIIAEHRINAAFPPFVRGEAKFRAEKWHDHTNYTLGLISRRIKKGFRVLAGGDLNTPRRVSGYANRLKERGSHFDRLGAHGFPLGEAEVLSKKGSDHNRLRATID